MANIAEINMEEYEKWLAILPINEREVISKYPPWKLYRLKSTDQRVIIISVGTTDEGEVKFRVSITGQYNTILFDREVFGIDPKDLEECDLPVFTKDEDINEIIKIIKEEMSD